MPLAVWPTTPPPLHPSSYRDDDPATEARFVNALAQQRASRAGRKARSYFLRFRTTNTNRLILQAFVEARRGTAESFLFKDLDDFTRTGITMEPATSDGVVTAFSLPTTGAYAGDYPVDSAAAILYRAAVDVGAITVQTDARTLTRSPAPAAGGAMTADYHYYRRVRLLEVPTWVHAPYGVWSSEVTLEEVAA